MAAQKGNIMPVQGSVTTKVNLESFSTTIEYGNWTYNPAFTLAMNLTPGNLDGQINHAYVDQQTLASGASFDYDFSGTLAFPVVGVFTPTTLVMLMVINAPIDLNAAPNTTNLTIGGGTNPITTFLGGTAPTIGPIRPGGMFTLSCGGVGGIGAITPGTADILRITNSAGASATYQLIALGRA